MYWADLGPQKILSGPDPAQNTGLGQDPPGPATNRAGGINFPPPLHAERYSFCMQRRTYRNARMGGRRVPGAEEAVAGCVSGGAVAEAGGAATVSGGLVRSPRCSFSPCFFSVCFFSFVFGLVLPLFPFLFSVFFRSPLFLLSPSFYLLLSLSSVFFVFFSPSPLCFFFFLFSPFSLCFSPLCSQRSWPLFIEAKDAVFYSSHGGAAGWSAIGRGCRGSVGGARWMVGHCVRSVGSRRESGRQNSN